LCCSVCVCVCVCKCDESNESIGFIASIQDPSISIPRSRASLYAETRDERVLLLFVALVQLGSNYRAWWRRKALQDTTPLVQFAVEASVRASVATKQSGQASGQGRERTYASLRDWRVTMYSGCSRRYTAPGSFLTISTNFQCFLLLIGRHFWIITWSPMSQIWIER